MRRGLTDEEFDRLYREHAAGLIRFLTFHTGDRVLAEDVAADTFERALMSRNTWRAEASGKTWLYAIAINRLRDLARRRGSESRALQRVVMAVPTQDDYPAIEDRDLVRRVIQRLSSEERTLVALRFGGNLSLPEMATLLGELESTVRGRLYRTVERIRRELA
jgi:RNA polymerase sigma-70 factor (ECF subfamily)